MSNIFIGIPMYGGVCTGENAIGHINATKLFLDRGIGYNWQFLYNESLITRARNGLVKMFYQTDCTHLLFIDADISYRAEDIVSMIDADKDIICGVYPKKRIAWERINDALAKGIIGEDLKHYTGDLVINKLNYVDTPIADKSEPVEIFNGGTGFMLIKRSVFDLLKPHCPTYTNDMLPGQQEIVTEYFATSIEPDSNRLLSEDYHFCRLARLNGIKVWAAPWVELGHIGSYKFEGKLL
ncbi:hypothetical protein UFOVP765_53 [uncultured Caudovirales phage]|jgi:hypothetical protein|uniref:Anp1 n=1 Tax=uncultured Caudovirales phage TaxID=2100421 RepID=A0A6J5NQ88_9CAUD|nr:hypothetical protein UFOVP765_53 [uncultured Caudovirales phage]